MLFQRLLKVHRLLGKELMIAHKYAVESYFLTIYNKKVVMTIAMSLFVCG